VKSKVNFSKMSKKNKGKKNKDFDSDLEEDPAIEVKGKSKGSRGEAENIEKAAPKKSKKKGKKAAR
jgi:hypothetical protein